MWFLGIGSYHKSIEYNFFLFIRLYICLLVMPCACSSCYWPRLSTAYSHQCWWNLMVHPRNHLFTCVLGQSITFPEEQSKKESLWALMLSLPWSPILWLLLSLLPFSFLYMNILSTHWWILCCFWTSQWLSVIYVTSLWKAAGRACRKKKVTMEAGMLVRSSLF